MNKEYIDKHEAYLLLKNKAETYMLPATKEAYEKAAILIASMKTHEVQPVDSWISVKDRLPEDDDKYMVWYKGECEICEFDTDSQTFGYTYDDYDEMYSHLVCWDDGIHKDVTHWRLLPEPPKGE